MRAAIASRRSISSVPTTLPSWYAIVLHCVPECACIMFALLTMQISVGYNFRFAYYTSVNGTGPMFRDLYKAFGAPSLLTPFLGLFPFFRHPSNRTSSRHCWHFSHDRNPRHFCCIGHRWTILDYPSSCCLWLRSQLSEAPSLSLSTSPLSCG
jgi:hypothetical protein